MQGLSGIDASFRCSDASCAEYLLLIGDTSDTTNAVQVVKKAAASTAAVIGVSTGKTTAADQNIGVRIAGIAKVKVDGNSGAIDIGDSIVPDSSARGVKAAAASATAQEAIGYALEPSAAANDVIDVLIDRHQITKGAS